MRNHLKKLNIDGMTLYEALIALAILAIGIVGIQSMMRRTLVSSVRAWDKEMKTSIGMSRVEEHKAELYSEFVPGLGLPILQPKVSTAATPSISFAQNAAIYNTSTEVSVDCTSNNITADTALGYGVTFATPGISPTFYYGTVNASPTPAMEWISINNQATCSQVDGLIDFGIITPPGVTGAVNLWFLDNMALQRQQTVWMNGIQKVAYTAGNISATPSAATTLSLTFNQYDSASGVLNFQIYQTGLANNWGQLIEDSTTNSQAMTIFPNLATNTPTPTTTNCPLGTCNYVNATSFTVANPFFLNFSQQYVECATGGGGSLKCVFNVSCPGNFIVQTNAASGRRNCNTALNAVLSGTGVVLQGGGGTTWYMDPSACNNNQSQTIMSGSPNFASSAPATWAISNNGSVTLTLTLVTGDSRTRGGNTTYWPQIYKACLIQVSQGAPTNTPTKTPTFAPGTKTPTPTYTPISSTFSFTQPTPIDLSTGLGAPWSVGTPVYMATPYGCDGNTNALVSSGLPDASGIVHWSTQNPVNLAGSPITLQAAGRVIADVRLMKSGGVTMNVLYNNSSTASGNVANPSATNPGWFEVASGLLSSGVTISKVSFDFTGLSTSTTSYLAVDSIRLVYTNPLNPNAVLMGFNLKALNHFFDFGTYAPYVTDSYVLPLTATGAASGYNIQVVVHNGTQTGWATPTPNTTPVSGTSPTPTPNSSPVPLVTVTDQFQPVTIIDSVSQ